MPHRTKKLTGPKKRLDDDDLKKVSAGVFRRKATRKKIRRRLG